MSGRTKYPSGPARNKAQEERAAADEHTKSLADTPDLGGRETWAHPAGHSGTRRTWAISLGMLASFVLAAGGLTFGPLALLWIGIALFVVLGAYSVKTHAWSDFVREKRRLPEKDIHNPAA
jgi:hypothetical protein